MLKKQTVKIDGRRISYFESGKGKPLVLLPGLGSDCTLWIRMIPYLSKHFHVYAFSLPVYGTRNEHGHRYSFRTLHKLLHKIVKHFGINNPVLIGHSLGALVSMIYTTRHPRKVSKLIMVSAPLTDHSTKPPFLWRTAVNFALNSKRIKDIVSYVENNPDLLIHLLQILLPRRKVGRTASTAQDLLRKLPVKAIATCYHDLFNINFRKYIEKVRTPTLVVHGTKDDVLAMFRGTALYPFIPTAHIATLPSQHFIPADMPNDLSHLVLNFIKNEKAINSKL